MAPGGALLAMSDAPHDTTPDASEAEVKALGDGNRAFAFALWDALGKQPGNAFFSPYSISAALAMTYAGARGDTAAEMQSALHFGSDQDALHAAWNATARALAGRKDELSSNTKGGGFELRVINQAWGEQQRTFESSYLDLLATHYGAGLFLLDFMGDPDGARTIINGWVAEQTRDRIDELLVPGSIESNTALVLTNAVYFKASWQEQFNVARTDSAVFHAEGGDSQAQMMHQTLRAEYADDTHYQAVDLAYASASVRMLVVMPAEGSWDAVSAELGATFEDARAHLTSQNVALSMPKFSFASRPALVPALKTLGMHDAFVAGAADFSGIDGTRDLSIADVIHEAFVAVDETGTEAAAATAAILVGRSAAAPPVTLTLDRPFFFFIHDEPTGEILFMGRVADPSAL